MSGRLALDISPEWKALYFPPKSREEVTPLIPDGHILGVRALARRKWRVWLMTDDLRPQDRRVVWQHDHIMAPDGAEACRTAFLLASRGIGVRGGMKVTTDAEGYIREMEPIDG